MTNLVYDESYFHDNDAGYTQYQRDLWPPDTPEHLQSRAQQLFNEVASRGASIANRKVLILGCAYGYTVEYLVGLGANAFGMDISAYAISQAPSSIAGRVLVGDARLRADLNAARSLAAIQGNARFDLIVSEDLLPCYTDAQAIAAAIEWRTRHGQRVAHRITIGNYQGGYNLKTLAQWRTLLGTADWIFDYMTWAEA